jgi:hypothetical protein
MTVLDSPFMLLPTDQRLANEKARRAPSKLAVYAVPDNSSAPAGIFEVGGPDPRQIGSRLNQD